MKTTITATVVFQVQTASEEDCKRFNRKLGSLEILDEDGDRWYWADSLDEARKCLRSHLENEVSFGRISFGSTHPDKK